VFSHIIGLDGQFSISPVDQYGELDSFGTAEIHDAVQSGANGSAGIQHIIDQDKNKIVDIEIDQGFAQRGPVADRRQVVPVQRHIQNADRHRPLKNGLDFVAQALSQVHSPAPDADDRKLGLGSQFLNNLSRHPCEHKIYFFGCHQELAFNFFHLDIALQCLLFLSRGDNIIRKNALQTASDPLYFFRMLDKKTKVKEILNLGGRNYLLTLNAPEQARLVRPGQFIMLKCVEDVGENPLLRRPFTIFNIRRQARGGKPSGLELLVKDVGIGTHKLVQSRPGQMLDCLGPQGHGFQISSEMKNRLDLACLVAGGVGIAPLFLLAQALQAYHVKPILFYGGAGIQDLVLREYFEKLGIEIIYSTEDGSLGERGLVTQPLAQFLKLHARKNVRLYACGPWGMMKAVHALSAQHHLQCEVSLEARMGCSLGACLGCVVGSRDPQGEMQFIRVCQDGPVMNSRLIDWDAVPV
jgi:dihydroorotate dehydrogenase electron transfer subunit